MQQVVAVGSAPLDAAIIGIAPLLLAYSVGIGRAGDRSVENGIAVGTSFRPALLEVIPAGVISLSRDSLAVLGRGTSSQKHH